MGSKVALIAHMKILLVQTSFLGDTVLSTPVINAIKVKHPQSELWMMTTPASKPLVENDPLLSKVITFDKRKSESGWFGLLRMARYLKLEKFDIVYSLHRSYRTALMLWLARIPSRIGFKDARLRSLYTQRVSRPLKEHEVKRSLSLIENATSVSEDLRIYLPPNAELSPSISTQVKAEVPYVVLVPGSVWSTKRWDWREYRETAKHFLALNYAVVLLGAPDEVEISSNVAAGLEVTNLTGKTTLAESMLLIKNASLVVCNDSLALHLACAFKVPTVTVFCATSPKFGFGPWRSPSIVVEQEGLSCKPCRRHGGMYCPTGTEACMKVSAQRVIDASAELLQRRPEVGK